MPVTMTMTIAMRYIAVVQTTTVMVKGRTNDSATQWA